MTPLVVLSTGLASQNKPRCLASVAAQTQPHRHIYVEASEQNPPRTKMQNLVESIATLEPQTVVVLLDGDDHFSRPDALAIVAKHYEDPDVWATYGSFVHADGRPGWAAPQPKTRTLWSQSHTKSFRAGVFNAIPREYLQYRGTWIDRGDDPAFMWSVLELAGADRTRFIAEVTYVYDQGASWEWSATPQDSGHERALVEYVRGLRPLERLNGLV